MQNARPASEFPERADAYFCDNCRRDITKYLHPHESHSWQPIGPQRYECLCGKRWLTGAVEWDHLHNWDKKRRIRDTLAFSVVITVVSSIAAEVVFISGSLAASSSVIIAVLPAVAFTGAFVVQIVGSMWRTRVR